MRKQDYNENNYDDCDYESQRCNNFLHLRQWKQWWKWRCRDDEFDGKLHNIGWIAWSLLNTQLCYRRREFFLQKSCLKNWLNSSPIVKSDLISLIQNILLFFLSLSSNFFASIHMKVWLSGGSYILLIMMSMDEDISRAKLARAQRNPENIVPKIFSYKYIDFSFLWEPSFKI